MGTKVSSKKNIKKSTKKGTSNSENKNIVTWAIVLVCLLIVLTISLTYAYFARNLKTTGEDPKTVVETGLLDVDFLTSEYITNKQASLIKDGQAYFKGDRTEFTVARSAKNTVEKVYYTLSLVDIKISDNLKSSYLKWRLYETADIAANTEPLSYGDFEDFEGTTLDLYSTKIPLAKEVTDSFVLVIWLSNDEDKNQTELLLGDFSAKVEVTAVNS